MPAEPPGRVILAWENLFGRASSGSSALSFVPDSGRVKAVGWRALFNPDSEVKNRARARSVGIVRRNKARIFSQHFVPLA
jgi:hypothetical protein